MSALHKRRVPLAEVFAEPARVRYARHDDRRAYEALVKCMEHLIALGEHR